MKLTSFQRTELTALMQSCNTARKAINSLNKSIKEYEYRQQYFAERNGQGEKFVMLYGRYVSPFIQAREKEELSQCIQLRDAIKSGEITYNQNNTITSNQKQSAMQTQTNFQTANPANIITDESRVKDVHLNAPQSESDQLHKLTIKLNAIAYERGKNALLSDITVNELREYVKRAYLNLPCNVVYVNREVTCKEMRKVYADTKIIIVSDLYNNSSLFPGELNLKFRAIHDYIHLTKGYGCDYIGEYNTFIEQSKNLSYNASQVLFSEVVLQASFFIYFGHFANVQKVVLVTL